MSTTVKIKSVYKFEILGEWISTCGRSETIKWLRCIKSKREEVELWLRFIAERVVKNYWCNNFGVGIKNGAHDIQYSHDMIMVSDESSMGDENLKYWDFPKNLKIS